MKKLVAAFCLTIISTVFAFAQTDSDEYKKNEFYAGYSNQQTDNFSRRTLHGFEGSYVRNVSRYFGIKGDFSAHYKKTNITSTNGNSSFSYDFGTSLYNFLGGVQIKDNASKARFKPFVHALAGVAVNHTTLKNIRCTSGNCSSINFVPASFNDTGFSAALGGGLDIKISKRLDFRAFQVDYNPIFVNSNRRQNNVRLGIGFVFK